MTNCKKRRMLLVPPSIIKIPWINVDSVAPYAMQGIRLQKLVDVYSTLESFGPQFTPYLRTLKYVHDPSPNIVSKCNFLISGSTNPITALYFRQGQDRCGDGDLQKVIWESNYGNFIGKSLFKDSSITEFSSFSDNMIIEESAFENCQLLQKVYFQSILRVYRYAFKNCPKLTTFQISPGPWEYLDENAFDTLHPSFKGFPDYIYKRFDELLLFNADCMSIVDTSGAFKYLRRGVFASTGIVQFISTSIVLIKARAFYNCTKLSILDIPKTARIEDEAFFGCVKLHIPLMISFPAIGDRAFYGCLYDPKATYTICPTSTTALFSYGLHIFSDIHVKKLIIQSAILPSYFIKFPEKRLFTLKDCLGFRPENFFLLDDAGTVIESHPYKVQKYRVTQMSFRSRLVNLAIHDNKNVFESDIIITHDRPDFSLQSVIFYWLIDGNE